MSPDDERSEPGEAPEQMQTLRTRMELAARDVQAGSGAHSGLKTTASGRVAEKPEILEMPLPAGYRFFLRGLDQPVQNQVFMLQKARQVIGRVDADITIDEPSISRKHAAIEIYDIDFAYVKDLASTNGTFLNGEMINAAKLRTGDTLAIGDCRMQFLVEAENPAK